MRSGPLLLFAAILLGAAAPSQLIKQQRILLGTTPEGAFVTACRDKGQIRALIVEVLNEAGYTITDYVLDRGMLIRARSRRYGYKGWPHPDVRTSPPHRPLTVDHTDRILADELFEFKDGRLMVWRSFGRPSPVTAPEAAQRGTDVGAAAAEYLAFMNTPAPPGVHDGGTWSCVRNGNGRCVSFHPGVPE
jgi:hypothetical protein